MSVTFETTIDQEQTIRPPEGVVLPQGKLRVHVEVIEEATTHANRPKYQWLLDLAKRAEEIDCPLPTDMAENHDHYAHGKPLK